MMVLQERPSSVSRCPHHAGQPAVLHEYWQRLPDCATVGQQQVSTAKLFWLSARPTSSLAHLCDTGRRKHAHHDDHLRSNTARDIRPLPISDGHRYRVCCSGESRGNRIFPCAIACVLSNLALGLRPQLSCVQPLAYSRTATCPDCYPYSSPYQQPWP